MMMTAFGKNENLALTVSSDTLGKRPREDLRGLLSSLVDSGCLLDGGGGTCDIGASRGVLYYIILNQWLKWSCEAGGAHLTKPG